MGDLNALYDQFREAEDKQWSSHHLQYGKMRDMGLTASKKWAEKNADKGTKILATAAGATGAYAGHGIGGLKGALIGGALGAGYGLLHGNSIKKKEMKRYAGAQDTQEQIDEKWDKHIQAAREREKKEKDEKAKSSSGGGGGNGDQKRDADGKFAK